MVSNSPSVSDSARLRPGDVVGGRYRVDRLVGQGGMAWVYAATDEVLGREVAIKVFVVSEVGEDFAGAHETRLLASLNHPGLVTVFDAGAEQERGISYLVMELVVGASLASYLRSNGVLGVAQVAAIGAPLAGALAYVHERGLIHRDVKPGNVLLALSDDGRVIADSAKLADFGIARFADATRHTMTGTTLGTAPYLSPEQVRGARLGPASDIYSLGLVLLEALTGEVAYPGSAVESAVARLHRGPDIPEYLGGAWVELLSAMTADEPSARPSAAAVGETLRRLTGEQRSGAPTRPMRLPQTDRLAAPVTSTTVHRPGVQVRGTAMLGRARSTWLLVGVVLVAVVVWLAVASSGGSSASGPTYPAVPGPVGTHLRELQQEVSR
ncbi:serine/threonine-protein kinase [Pedococcus sp. NPDC057267]|uniref:serine/threonine-protein kinase n=1 Tax=Pedococcus sp. NPDC057267 TaxID=3346077 RepID=UPI00363864F7